MQSGSNKICLVIHSLQPGGMERVMSELANYMCSQAYLEVHLVMCGIKPEIFYSVPSNLLIHQPNWEFDNSKRIWNTIKRMGYLRHVIKQINPSSILSFGEYWNSFVLLSLIGLKYQVFVSDRCQPDKSIGRLNEALRRCLYPKAAGIIAQTHIAKEIYLKQFYHPNVRVIGNPIRIIQKNKNIGRENIVLSVGRLIETKHFDQLIRVFARMNVANWKLVIVGDDAIKQQNKLKLQKLITELSMQGKIVLAGKQFDVDSYYLKSKIFAFTSSSEGFPNVIGEAQSAGLPVVAFDCIAGPSDLIEDGINGFLIPLFDFKTFQNRLKYLMDSDVLISQFSNAASNSVKKFSSNIVCHHYLEFLTEKI